jgi:hypothetical protein
LATEEKLIKIESYIKLNIQNKKNYFNASRQDVKIIEDCLERLNRNEYFDQTNFKTLVERCKILINVRLKLKKLN